MTPATNDTGVRTLAVVLALSIWFASASFVQAILGGLGEHPTRRIVIGVALLTGYLLAWTYRPRVAVSLSVRPWVVVVIAALVAGAAVVDEPVGGPYFSVSLTVIGLAVVVASTRTVWLTLLCVCSVALAGAGVASLEHHGAPGETGTVLGAILGCSLGTLLLVGIRAQLFRLTGNLDGALEDLRMGRLILSPALSQAALDGTPAVALLSPPAAHAGLTEAEAEVVEALAQGRAPKQIARDRGVSINTIRTQLRRAKSKTGARTLRELASLVTHPDWPHVEPFSA